MKIEIKHIEALLRFMNVEIFPGSLSIEFDSVWFTLCDERAQDLLRRAGIDFTPYDTGRQVIIQAPLNTITQLCEGLATAFPEKMPGETDE